LAIAHTAPAAAFVLYHTIGIGAMNKFGIYFQWRGVLFFIFIVCYVRKRRNECSAPMELALRISRLCDVLTAVGSCFHNCQLKGKNNWRWDTLKSSHEMRDGQILKKYLCIRHLIKATFS
jgi:hypothetical protein